MGLCKFSLILPYVARLVRLRQSVTVDQEVIQATGVSTIPFTSYVIYLLIRDFPPVRILHDDSYMLNGCNFFIAISGTSPFFSMLFKGDETTAFVS